MAYEKQNWISYDDNKTEEQNIQDGAVVTAERMNHIESGLVDHVNSKENPHGVTAHQVGALTEEETYANVIDQLSGIETAIVKKVVLVNGVEGTASRDTANGVSEPFNQADYDNLTSLDNYVRNEVVVDGQRAKIRAEFPIISILESKYPDIFYKDMTLDEKLAKLKAIIRSFSFLTTARGYEFSRSDWHNYQANNWADINTMINRTSEFVQKEMIVKPVPDVTFSRLFGNTGVFKTIVYSGMSDGIKPTWIELQDIRLIVEFEANGRTVVESIVAQYSGENIDKKFVGLENVDNYGTATQAEAENGTSTDKFMTPLRTKQQVTSRIASQTEAETGVSTEKIMTPLRTKQHLDKRIATQAEAEAGTSETAIMTPKATKQAIEKIAANTSIARKSFTGVSTIETSERGKFNPDGAIISFKRTGNLVLFNAKLNHTGGMKWVTNIMSTGIPIGYRASKDFYETQFALPLIITPPKQSGTTLQWARYTIDDDNIFIYSDNTGNHFISGEWLTIDPFPETDIV